jgi:hypothetical protein
MYEPPPSLDYPLQLTYMLIQDEIERLCDNGRLLEVEPLDWRTEKKRNLYVSRDIHRFLAHKSDDARTNKDRRMLQALFDRFISGNFISVGLEPPVMYTDIKRLSPAYAEVWEFKVGKKQCHLRVFGRFAALNTFVTLTGPVDRVGLDYSNEILRCQEEWRNLLDGQPPVYGRYESDYISPNGVSLRDS